MPSAARIFSVDCVADRIPRFCWKCRHWKADDEFSPHSGKSSGFRSWCKQCDRLTSSAYYHEGGGKEKRAAYVAREDVKQRYRERARRQDVKQRWLKLKRLRDATPRGKFVNARNNARYRLGRARTEERRAEIEAVIALCDREIARLDRGFELPAEPPGRAATKRGRACAGPG